MASATGSGLLQVGRRAQLQLITEGRAPPPPPKRGPAPAARKRGAAALLVGRGRFPDGRPGLAGLSESEPVKGVGAGRGSGLDWPQTHREGLQASRRPSPSPSPRPHGGERGLRAVAAISAFSRPRPGGRWRLPSTPPVLGSWPAAWRFPAGPSPTLFAREAWISLLYLTGGSPRTAQGQVDRAGAKEWKPKSRTRGLWPAPTPVHRVIKMQMAQQYQKMALKPGCRSWENKNTTSASLQS
ncbi:transmembrane protein 272 isoform X2 [Crotalus tigris]|uniref:transmembrane protein 272 isoform X2 n=1 Tax=Crotalus tigris TaxID=88082 RepID=UPI00192F2D9E|nr:transmembrane protein 272 isoform X2 [Crotalus tigris]